ncbi:hypothetical protein [Cohnella sp. JJ-181]|uniref:hypothetical protein n=1 Tax=Cohnella rhizoplanae TaxID=2974897 RepID=UPI0022FF6BC9|nr:hypothetical protein [Cohnella sp. JJ-181]CAI6049578.1 hypothetical protein COHCIP112018_01421 [Cohnella sp. JJ-181]
MEQQSVQDKDHIRQASAALEGAGIRLAFASRRFEGSAEAGMSRAEWKGPANAIAGTVLDSGAGGEWLIRTSGSALTGPWGGFALETDWLHCGASPQTAAEVRFELGAWSRDVYALVPGAVYGGNRFEARRLNYAPCWTGIQERGPDAPALITDVPRLASDDGASSLHLLTGDASTPAVGFYDPASGRGCIVLTEQRTPYGETSIHIEESADRGSAIISFRAPGVRAGAKYEMCTTEAPSPDRGADYANGDRLTLRYHVYLFSCSGVPRLFEAFAAVRQSLSGLPKLAMSIPFSAAWEIQEAKFNAMNWRETHGYYAVGTVDEKHQDWQLGWVGGGMSSYALLLEGEDASKERALRTLDFIFGGQTQAGFFPGVFYRGRWYGDEFGDDPNREAPERWHIVRKSADALYFAAKHLLALAAMRPETAASDSWLQGLRKLADAFVRLWDTYGTFGQWINHDTGELLVGGSAGGAMAIGGLALCGELLRDERYSAVARAAGEDYYRRYTEAGITTGGPGEILQCPDSESAFALLESYIALFETTGEREWIGRAEEAADQCMSWCVSYDFEFPADSTFGRLGMRTAGSVIANVQNKHSAPGICTLSGDSLLKLFRATGKVRYLTQLRETAHNMTQYLSRADRPIMGWDGKDMPPGYMSERVNMSDWEGAERVGEALPLSCWCETSNMLTYAEVPGIYAQSDTGFVCVMDHVVGRIESGADGGKTLRIDNPTPWPATVKLLVENAVEAEVPLAACASATWPRIRIGPGETRSIALT